MTRPSEKVGGGPTKEHKAVTLPAGSREAAQVAKAAGFTGRDLVIAVAVAGAESNYRPGATNRNRNASTDYGAWEINSIHAAVLASGNWQNLGDNARMARTVFDRAGQRWTPWSTYNNGRYKHHLVAAQAAVDSLEAVS